MLKEALTLELNELEVISEKDTPVEEVLADGCGALFGCSGCGPKPLG